MIVQYCSADMDDETRDFWLLFQDARRESGDIDPVTREILVTKLAAFDDDQLAAFDDFFTEQIEALNTSLVRNAARQFWTLSDESWLFLRAWIVSRGGEVFTAFRSNPELLVSVATDRPGPFDAPSGERFMDCPHEARLRRGRPG